MLFLKGGIDLIYNTEDNRDSKREEKALDEKKRRQKEKTRALVEKKIERGSKTRSPYKRTKQNWKKNYENYDDFEFEE